MKTFIQTLLGMVVLIAVGMLYLNMPVQWRRHKDIQLGNQIIAQIQQFQRSHQRLPETAKPNLSRSALSTTNKAGNPTTSATAPANTKSATKTAMLPPICAGNRASKRGNWRNNPIHHSNPFSGCLCALSHFQTQPETTRRDYLCPYAKTFN